MHVDVLSILSLFSAAPFIAIAAILCLYLIRRVPWVRSTRTGRRLFGLQPAAVGLGMAFLFLQVFWRPSLSHVIEVQQKVDVDNDKAIALMCRKWKTTLECVEKNHLRVVHLLVDGYFPEKEIRTQETAAAVSHVAAVPKVRDWMKKKQRECIQFGNLVMEGRDIGTNVFPETDYKFYLDATLAERSARRAADGVNENLAARDQRDSQRAVAPLMIALGALYVLQPA